VTPLLSSEIRRLASRRLVKWMLLVSVVLVLVLAVIVTANSDPGSVNENDVMTLAQLWLSKASADRLGLKRDNAIATVSVLTYLLVVVIGASAVGAEYRAGTVGTILTWEPRRIRLLIARLLAVAIISMAFFVIVQVVFVGAWAAGVALNGRSSGAGSSFWSDLVLLLGRATFIGGALATMSAALATLGKNTAAAMGIWFGYLIAVEAILRSQIDAFVPWFLTPVVGSTYGWESVTQNGHTVSPGSGALKLVLYVVLFAGVAVAVFRRRDVT
jgi:ABC-2 type transport system permease protein